MFAAFCNQAVPGVIAEEPFLIHGGHGDGSQTLGAGGRRVMLAMRAVAEDLEKTVVRVLGV